MSRAGGVFCGVAQQSADGVLFTVATGAGGAAQPCARAAGGRDGQRLGQHAASRADGETGQDGLRQPDIRLGLNRIRGMRKPAAERIEAARAQAPFTSVEDLAHRAALDRHDLNVLAAANALKSLAGHRRQALWQTLALQEPGRDHALLRQARPVEAPLELPAPPIGEEVMADYGSLGLSLQSHPVGLLRARLERMRFATAATLAGYRNGQLARACGIVTVRQRPGTANGTIFVSIEDETGAINVILWPHLIERQRREVLGAQLLGVYGKWQCERETRHLVAQHLVDLTPLWGGLPLPVVISINQPSTHNCTPRHLRHGNCVMRGTRSRPFGKAGGPGGSPAGPSNWRIGQARIDETWCGCKDLRLKDHKNDRPSEESGIPEGTVP